MEVGDLKCVGVINGASCDMDGVCLGGEAVGKKSFGGET